MILLAFQPAMSAAQTLSQTGRWRGLYELGPSYPDGYPGAHVAVLKGTADSTCVLLFGQTAKFGRWSFIPRSEPTVPTNGVNFFDLTPPGHDVFCAGHASVNGRLVVVGGQYRPEVGTETAWEFNPLYTDPSNPAPPWRQLGGTARGRWYPTVTALSTHQLLATSGTKYGYAFMFGGDTGTLENDLRPLAMGNTVDWAVPVATGDAPSKRKDHTATLQHFTSGNPYLTRMIIFGGETGPGQKSRDVRSQYLRGDTDSSSIWASPIVISDVQNGLPDERSRHTAIYYAPNSGKPMLIVYGGSNASGGALGDVWKGELSPPTINSDTVYWTRLLASSGTDDGVSGPGNRYGHAAIFDAGPGGNSPRMLVFGGRSSSTQIASTHVWSLNLTGVPQWTRIFPSGGPPDAREGHAAVADDYDDGAKKFRMVIFGVRDGTNPPLADTWSLWRLSSGNSWTWALAPAGSAPPARWRAAANKDWFWDRMVVFGGQGVSAPLDDLWALDLGNSAAALTWSPVLERSPSTYPKPAARAGHTLVAHPLAIVERYPEVFHPTAEVMPPPGEWQTLPDAPSAIDTYPFMFVLPSRNVFHAGWRDDTKILNANSWTWGGTITPKPSYAVAGSAVMYRPGSILRCGRYGEDGYTGVSNTDTVRFSGPSDTNNGWTEVATAFGQLSPRKYHNLTVLPTGDVLVTGGLRDDDSTNAEKRPQVWKRDATGWSAVTAMVADPAIRNYHSAAILLPDARVLSTGGEGFNMPGRPANLYRDMATIFEPPYLFSGNGDATRPVIARAPCRIRYGQEFFIGTPDVAGMVGAPGGTVCLISPGAVTHGFNQDQRYVPLNMYECSYDDRLRIVAPADSGIAPPGDYMLFIVNNAGVPSIAKWVRVGSVAPPNCDLDVPNRVNAPDPQVEIASDTEVWFYWTAPWDNPGANPPAGTVAEYDMRAGASSMDEAAFCAGWRGNALEPLSAGGQSQYGWVSGLLPCTPYRIALKARDGTENWSPISNEAVVTTMCGGGGGGFQAQPGAPVVGATPASDDGAPRAHGTAPLLGATSSNGAEPLGMVPEAATAWAVEMDLSDNAPVWSVYALGEEEAQSLFSRDSAGIVVQGPSEQGRRLTRARLFPGAASTRFALGRLSRPGRLVFWGQFEFREAWAAVATGAPNEVYEVVSAHHSRLGDQTAAMDLTGNTSSALVPGDTLSLTYRRSPSTADGVSDWFMLLGDASSVVPTLGNRRSRPPGASPLPTDFALHANRPNPFQRLTTLRFALPRDEHVRLDVFDLLGRRVRTVADGTFEGGEHTLPWDGRDANGALAPVGVYLARMQAGEFRAQRTMVLLP